MKHSPSTPPSLFLFKFKYSKLWGFGFGFLISPSLPSHRALRSGTPSRRPQCHRLFLSPSPRVSVSLSLYRREEGRGGEGRRMGRTRRCRPSCSVSERGRGAAGAGSGRCPWQCRAQVRGCPAAPSPAVPQGGGAGKGVPASCQALR